MPSWQDAPETPGAGPIKPSWQHAPVVKNTAAEQERIDYNVAHPKARKPLRVDITADDADDQRPASFLVGVGEGVAKPFINAASAVYRGLDAVGLTPPGQTPDEARASFKDSTDALPYRGSGFGRLLGEAVGTAPTALIPGGLLAQGAAAGALLSDADSVGELVADTAAGAVGSRVGAAIVNRIAGAVAPTIGRNLQILRDAGVRFTPGQAGSQGGRIGNAINTVEASLGNFPIAGTPIQAARGQAVEDLNRAATNRALRPIGHALPDDVATGHDAIRYAGDRLRDAYNDVLPRLNGNIDQTFGNRIRAIRQRANLPQQYDDLLNQAQVELSNAFDPAAGTFRGRDVQRVSDRLDKLASGWRQSAQDPYIREVGEAAEEMRQQLHALVRRNNPADAARLRNIDAGYASLVRTERAALTADDGIFSAGAYKQAVRTTDRSTRKRAVARGLALDQDLANAGAAVLPSKVGAGGSTAVNSLAALGLLSSGALAGDARSLGLLGGAAVGALPYTPVGGNVARFLLSRQAGPGAQATANLLRQSAPAVGALIPPALDQ